jgi:hypothetical protein
MGTYHSQLWTKYQHAKSFPQDAQFAIKSLNLPDNFGDIRGFRVRVAFDFDPKDKVPHTIFAMIRTESQECGKEIAFEMTLDGLEDANPEKENRSYWHFSYNHPIPGYFLKHDLIVIAFQCIDSTEFGCSRTWLKFHLSDGKDDQDMRSAGDIFIHLNPPSEKPVASKFSVREIAAACAKSPQPASSTGNLKMHLRLTPQLGSSQPTKVVLTTAGVRLKLNADDEKDE